MENNVKITEAEWKIMDYLWKSGGCALPELREALKSTGWDSSTIKTLVIRLIKKGAIKTEGKVRRTVYSPAVSIDECRLRETRDLLMRAYNGSVKMMVANLVKDSGLSDSDEKELMELIDKMED